MNEFQKLLDKKLKEAVIDETVVKIDKFEYDISKEVQEAIIELRKELGISQKELAAITGISQANMSKIENGRHIPSLLILKRIADGLGKRLSVEFIDPEENL